MNHKQHYAICIDNSAYPASLERHKLYRVLKDDADLEQGDIRILDESGEDYIYPADYFLEVDFPQATSEKLARTFA